MLDVLGRALKLSPEQMQQHQGLQDLLSGDGGDDTMSGGAHGDTLEFRADEAEPYVRHYLASGGAGSWWYGPYVDFYLAGDTGDYIDIAGVHLQFDTR